MKTGLYHFLIVKMPLIHSASYFQAPIMLELPAAHGADFVRHYEGQN